MDPAALEYDPQCLLVEAMQAGDAQALSELIGTQGRWVRGVAFGVLGRDAELDDVCQKVWMKAWQECGSLGDTRAWRSWLYRIARNMAMDSLRATRRRGNHVQTRDADDLAEGDRRSRGTAPPDQQAVAREERETMLAAIADLPPLYREPFVLKHVEGWSYAQIGETLGLPSDTVETRLVRARRLLREKLTGKV